MEEFVAFLIIGFLAQLIDVALGMAYGLTATSLLLSLGVPPVVASATTHAAECVTTGFSAIAHHQFGNVNRFLFQRLLIPGILGSILGAYILTQVDAKTIRPFVAAYLMIMGVVMIVKIFREFPPYTVKRLLIPLGFVGAFLDASGGGGWGSIVTSTLLVRGADARTTIGSVNACEFFIAVTASVTFFLSGVNINWEIIIALAIGGALASPLGAWACKYLPHRWLLLIVGMLIVVLSGHMVWLEWT